MQKPDKFRTLFAWVIGVSFIFVGYFLFRMVMFTGFSEEFLPLYKQHFQALVGLPAAAFAATFIILILKISGGPIEFSGLGFQFKGASGQVVLWIFCFLAIVGSIKLLW